MCEVALSEAGVAVFFGVGEALLLFGMEAPVRDFAVVVEWDEWKL